MRQTLPSYESFTDGGFFTFDKLTAFGELVFQQSIYRCYFSSFDEVIMLRRHPKFRFFSCQIVVFYGDEVVVVDQTKIVTLYDKRECENSAKEPSDGGSTDLVF